MRKDLQRQSIDDEEEDFFLSLVYRLSSLKIEFLNVNKKSSVYPRRQNSFPWTNDVSQVFFLFKFMDMINYSRMDSASIRTSRSFAFLSIQLDVVLSKLDSMVSNIDIIIHFDHVVSC